MTHLPYIHGLLVGFVCATVFGACNAADFSGSSRSGVNGRAATKPGDDSKGGDHAEDTDGKPDSGGPDSDGDGSPYTHAPITPDLGGSGWVGKEGFPELQELFGDDDGGSGGGPDGPGGPGGPGGPNGSGGSGGSDSSGSGGGGGPNGSGGSDGNGPGSVGDSGKSSDAGSGGDTGSGRGGDVPGWSDGENGVFWMPCNDDQGGGTKSGSIKGPLDANVRVAGELCPIKNTQGALTVLFVVDYSGSMTGIVEGPNDPGDNCGRMRAADALLKKFAGPDYKGYDIKFGLVGFSNDASIRLPFQDLNSMQATIAPGTWCGSDSGLALTNYNAAFTVAAQALQNVQGRSVIYFISDGSPTTGGGLGGDASQAGLQAATALRDAHKDSLALNAVFLGYKSGLATNPQGYLEQITGDPQRVRVVDGANDLVEAVKGLDTGLPKIEKNAVQATLEAAGVTSDVGIATVKPHKKKAGAYIYMTKPFILKGEMGKDVVNELSVKAKTDEGKTVGATATITFTATE